MSVIQKYLKSNLFVRWFDFRSGSLFDLSKTSTNKIEFVNTPYLTNKGLKLNAQTSSYVTSADADDLSFGNGTTDEQLTFVWYGEFLKTGPNYIIGKNKTTASAGVQEYLLFHTNANKIYFRCYDASNSAYIGRYYNTALALNREYVIAVTYDASKASTGIKIYIDGVEVSTVDNSTGTYVAMENLGQDLVFGRAGPDNATVHIKSVLMINSALSAKEIAEITSEIKRSRYGSRSHSRSKAKSYTDVNDPSLIVYHEFDKSSGTLTDLSGHGNDMALTGTWNLSDEDVGLAAYVGVGSDGVITTPTTELAELTQSGSMSVSVWVKNMNVPAVNRILLGQEGGTGTGRNWISVNNNALGGSVVATQLGGSWQCAGVNADNNQWTHICLNYLGVVPPDLYGRLQLWVNGVEQINGLIIDIDEGADGPLWFTSNSVGGQDFYGGVNELKIFNRGLLQHEIMALYNKGVVHFTGEYGVLCNPGPIGTSTFLSNTPFFSLFGSYGVVDDTINNSFVKVIKCITTGVVYLSNQNCGMTTSEEAAYGTWEFWVYKNLDTDVMSIGFSTTYVNDTGYTLQLNADNSVGINELTGGGITSLMNTAAGFMSSKTWYGFKITNDATGKKTLYVRGGSFGNDYVLVNVATGFNPVTDNTHTTSLCFCIDMPAEGRFCYAGINNKYSFIKRLSA